VAILDGIMVTMADSDALRQQRRRRHRAGDHSMCRRGCRDARLSPEIESVSSGSGEKVDPAVALRELAVRLQEASRVDPANALLAKELRATLLVLMPSREAVVDAEFRQLVAELGKPVDDA
jgi:hypothetical protein